MSSQKIARVKVSLEARTVTWTFEDGTERVWRYDNLPEDMKVAAALHGMKQKGSDCYAGAGKEADPIDYAKDEQDGVWKAILNGEWNRTGGLGGMVYKAIAEATGKSEEDIISLFEAMDKSSREAKLKQLRKHPKFKEVYTRMQAERAAKQAQEAPDIEDILS